MKRCGLLVLLSVVLLTRLTAQNSRDRAVTALHPPEAALNWTSPVKPVPLQDAEPFLSFFIVWEGEGEQFEVRFSGNGEHWSDWQTLERDPHNPHKRVTRPLFTETGHRYFQLRYRGMKVAGLACHFFSPGATPLRTTPPSVNPQWRDDECPSPPVVERSEWCPGGGCPGNSNPSPTEVSHLIIHHSAGANIADDWSAVVRAIWDLHVNGNGWSDIGYNYLVDPSGVVYAGRGNDVLGAHFCAANSNTMGVCILGNFQEGAPREAALNSLVQLLAWKSNERDLDPLGSAPHAASGLNLMHISGHRDGCPTACPGDRFYPLLPDLRFRIADSLAACRGLTTGVPEPLSLTEALRLSPNPAGNQLQLRFDSRLSGAGQVEIFGVDGRRQAVRQFQKDNGPFQLDVSLAQMPAGYYWLRLSVGEVQGVASFVKQ